MSTSASSVATRPSPSSDARRSLILGLLSIPGSTLAWDLPLGGMWIGLPLGVAAILYGRRARSDGTGGKAAIAGIVLASLAIVQMAIWTVVSVVS